MCPQSTWTRGEIIKLFALVLLFSTVRFHVRPQVSCLIQCILALVICLLPTALFVSKSLLKVLGPDNAKSQCLHVFKYSLLGVLRFTIKLYAWKDTYSHRFNLFDGSLPCIFKCAFKLPFLIEVYSHLSHVVNFSPLCVIKCVLKLAF